MALKEGALDDGNKMAFNASKKVKAKKLKKKNISSEGDDATSFEITPVEISEATPKKAKKKRKNKFKTTPSNNDNCDGEFKFQSFHFESSDAAEISADQTCQDIGTNGETTIERKAFRKGKKKQKFARN